MTRIGLFLLVAAVVGSAAWAYHVNYKTRNALDRIDVLRGQIAAEREAVEVLRVEWAYLNSPERLTRLVAKNNEDLQLQPMGPEGFDTVSSVPFPPRTAPEAAPGTLRSDPVVVSERQPIVVARVPQPAPRPAAWSRQ
ncbi:MAG: cell division protein FtsL [Paracoccaceae bacterium]|nr:cell division protein FtsL [Paracoccaceae bacterium]